MANDHGLLDNEAATLHVLQVVHIAATYAYSSNADAHFIGLQLFGDLLRKVDLD